MRGLQGTGTTRRPYQLSSENGRLCVPCLCDCCTDHSIVFVMNNDEPNQRQDSLSSALDDKSNNSEKARTIPIEASTGRHNHATGITKRTGENKTMTMKDWFLQLSPKERAALLSIHDGPFLTEFTNLLHLAATKRRTSSTATAIPTETKTIDARKTNGGGEFSLVCFCSYPTS